MTDGVADLIRTAILAGDVLAGESLSESRLARQLEVARGTVREAIQGLVGEGLVEHRAHRGFSVVRIGVDDVRDIYRLRKALELGALIELGKRVREAVPAAEAALGSMAGAVEARDWRGVFEADLAFHLSVIEVAGSRRLASTFRSVMRELQVAMVNHDRTTRTESGLVASHETLLTAMRAGDEARLRDRVAHHVADSEALLLGSAG